MEDTLTKLKRLQKYNKTIRLINYILLFMVGFSIGFLFAHLK